MSNRADRPAYPPAHWRDDDPDWRWFYRRIWTRMFLWRELRRLGRRLRGRR